MARGKRAKASDLREDMAKRLRAARYAYNQNGAEVARALGVTPQVLNAYEKGRNYPDATFLVNFCNLTDCPIDWVFRGKMEAAMPPRMASLIGFHFPDLLPELAEASPASRTRVREPETTP